MGISFSLRLRGFAYEFMGSQPFSWHGSTSGVSGLLSSYANTEGEVWREARTWVQGKKLGYGPGLAYNSARFVTFADGSFVITNIARQVEPQVEGRSVLHRTGRNRIRCLLALSRVGSDLFHAPNPPAFIGDVSLFGRGP